ncbi:MAG: hypothetical protein D6782_04880 [Alphaproteobacteria bacterium]|nr:MAG: hypothetical protein D6782_04880 [Alphaproteobacteria bacterium]
MTRIQQRILSVYLVFWGATAFALAYGFLWRFAGLINIVIFWMAFAWLLLLLVLVLAVGVKRLTAPPPSRLRMKTGLVFKPGAALVTWLFAAVSAYCLYQALTLERDSWLVRGYPMLQMALLAFYVALMGWAFIDYFIGLPANAGIKAAQNLRRLEDHIDQIAYCATSDWLAGARGVTAQGRLRATLGWWEEALVAAFPRQGLEMALPAVGQFIEQLGRDVTAIEAMHERRLTTREALEEAERRALDGIRRAERVAGRVLV